MTSQMTNFNSSSGPRINRRDFLTLDQDGNLMIAHPSPEGFKISAKASLLSRLSWTPPALVGTRLYIRDRGEMMAVELG
jgi:hypothetical protein